jgi:hypothetical protein
MESIGRLTELWAAADELGRVGPEQLARLCASPLARDRLIALLLMRRQINRFGPLTQYVEALGALTRDPEADCRWLAMQVLADLVEWYPERVWQVIRDCCEGDDEDMRSVAMGLLLTRLLLRHGGRFKSELDTLTQRSPRFARAYALRLLNSSAF